MASLSPDILDAVFSQSPSQFIASRKALAKQLVLRGEAESAAAVRAIKKPSTVAAAVNELARTHPTEMAALIQAGRKVRTVQQAVMNGQEPTSLKAAIADEQRAVESLVAFADAHPGWSAATRLGVRASLRAGAHGSEEVSERLRRGWLEEELHATGFDALMGMPISTPKTPTLEKERRAQDERVAHRQKMLSELGAQVARAQADAMAKERSADSAEEAAARLRADARHARESATELEKKLEHLRRDDSAQ